MIFLGGFQKAPVVVFWVLVESRSTYRSVCQTPRKDATFFGLPRKDMRQNQQIESEIIYCIYELFYLYIMFSFLKKPNKTRNRTGSLRITNQRPPRFLTGRLRSKAPEAATEGRFARVKLATLKEQPQLPICLKARAKIDDRFGKGKDRRVLC